MTYMGRIKFYITVGSPHFYFRTVTNWTNHKIKCVDNYYNFGVSNWLGLMLSLIGIGRCAKNKNKIK